MKVLILSCSMGEGHNSAAKAVYEAVIDSGNEALITDVLSFGGKKPPKIAEGSYRSIVTKAPRVFGAIYKVGGAYNATGLRSPVYFVNTLYAEKLRDYIIENGYTAVVATHLFAMQALTHIRRKYKDFSVKCYGVLTDYTCIPFFNESELDAFFVPHKEAAAECARKGMDKSRLINIGIPVSLKFNISHTKDEARKMLSLPSGKIFVVMTGGLGCGNAVELCRGLLSGADKDTYIYVLYGKNEGLHETLKECFKDNDNVRTVGFTDKVALYMKSADVLLTKPGGISSTEAAVTNVPLIHTMPIPGCETKNADLFERNAMSIKALSPKKAAEQALLLINDPEKCERMRNNQRAQINANAARDIVAYIKEHD